MRDGASPSLALGAYLARLGHAGGRVPTWHVLAALHLAHATHIPFENLDHGEIVVTPDHMREWYAQLEISNERLITILTREPDGVISSITDVGWAPHRPAMSHER